MEAENPRSVGTVKVDISSLAFKSNIGSRKIDQAIVNRIERVLSVACSRIAPENHLPAIINPAELDHVLLASGLTRNDLQTSLLGGPYPRLHLERSKLYCLHGKHCLQAAMKVLAPEDRWWTIRLYSLESGTVNDTLRGMQG